MILSPADSSCPDGWDEYSDKCYVYVPIKATWPEAERNCLLLGGNLVSVQDHSEYTFLLSVIEKSSRKDQRAWVGATDAIQEGLWLLSDGSRLNYHNWSEGQPSNYKGQEHCMEMNYGADRGQNDAPCWHAFPFLCSS
ncbi:ladderlectin isoform X3 [Esox lucius]|uniref:ladderlectin isoform X3 n=1 Tax=Esox lucius TaxID=8010 RepID=UPI00147710C7|nr:ladderlectin isoform X3 [Esox lucius]